MQNQLFLIICTFRHSSEKCWNSHKQQQQQQQQQPGVFPKSFDFFEDVLMIKTALNITLKFLQTKHLRVMS